MLLRSFPYNMSMKTCKLLPIVLLVGACTLSAHAQKLKYMPEAIKGVKAVPYVVEPKLPTTVRTGLSVPVVRPQATPTARPNVATAVERAVAAQLSHTEPPLQEKGAAQARQANAQQQELDEQFMQQLSDQEQAAQERAWKQVLLQDKAWKAQPEDIVPDPAKNAEKAAALGEKQITFPGTVTTDDYVEQLLNFYNKLDPLGTGTIQ